MSSPPALTPVESALKEAYLREFNEIIERPAIFNDPRAVDCYGRGHLTSTAYLKTSAAMSRLLSLYSSRDGTQLLAKNSSTVLRPAGTFRVLVVIVQYPTTTGPDALAAWQNAQQQINKDHADFAASRRYRSPIVVFDNTNLFVDRRLMFRESSSATRPFNPRDPASVRMAAELQGVSPGDYTIIICLDIDPARPEGGASLNSERFIRMGNMRHWQTVLTARDWLAIARAAYHHEMAHQWGWPADHVWAPYCDAPTGFEPFIVPPVLLGWEDVDGDGVPEILDDSPYGRRQ